MVVEDSDSFLIEGQYVEDEDFLFTVTGGSDKVTNIKGTKRSDVTQ